MRIRARARGRLVVSMLALLAGLASRGAARAATTPGPAAAGDEKQARTLYERAEKSFDIGKFADALVDYQSAYEAKPLPGFLFNIAQCYRNMGNFERARFFFRRYLTLDPRAPNRRRVEELIAEMSKQLEAQAAAPPSAQASSPPPARPPVDPKPVEASSMVAPLAPPSVPPVAPLTAAPVLTATAPPPLPASRAVWRRWWFWTGVGAVIAGGVVAGLFVARPETRTPGSLDPIDGRAP